MEKHGNIQIIFKTNKQTNSNHHHKIGGEFTEEIIVKKPIS